MMFNAVLFVAHEAYLYLCAPPGVILSFFVFQVSGMEGIPGELMLGLPDGESTNQTLHLKMKMSLACSSPPPPSSRRPQRPEHSIACRPRRQGASDLQEPGTDSLLSPSLLFDSRGSYRDSQRSGRGSIRKLQITKRNASLFFPSFLAQGFE